MRISLLSKKKKRKKKPARAGAFQPTRVFFFFLLVRGWGVALAAPSSHWTIGLRARRLRTINDYAGPRFIKLTAFQHLPVISIWVHVNEAASLTSRGEGYWGDSPH